MKRFEDEDLAAVLEARRKKDVAFFVGQWASYVRSISQGLDDLQRTGALPTTDLSSAEVRKIRNAIVHGKLSLPSSSARYLDAILAEALLLERIESPNDENVSIVYVDSAHALPYNGQTSRAHQAARTIFWLLELVLPRRIAAEEIGDALEDVHRLSRQSRPPWQIYLKVITTVFWVLINALRELSSALLGRKRA